MSFKEDTQSHSKNTPGNPRKAQSVAKNARTVPSISMTSHLGWKDPRAEALLDEYRNRDQGQEQGADNGQAAEGVALGHGAVDEGVGTVGEDDV